MSDEPMGCIAGNEGCCGLWSVAYCAIGVVVAVLGFLFGPHRWRKTR